MMHDRLTTVAEVREHMGGTADLLNVFVATSVMALRGEEGEEAHSIGEADRLQVEGFILQPRKLRSFPVEVVAETADDADYLLQVIHDSAAVLGARAAEGLRLAADQRFGLHVQLGSRLAGGAR